MALIIDLGRHIMPTWVHISFKVERQLATLERQENTLSIAAIRSRRIIDALMKGERPTRAGLLKRKTDKRVKNCFKFDLGSGFRLICIREGKNIYVLFVGDHDSADTWLDNYPRKKPCKTDIKMHSHIVDKQCTMRPGVLFPIKDTVDDPCLTKITQENLRRVFKGLVGF